MTPAPARSTRHRRHILLFDLDAVLLTSEGYYESLRRAVSLIGEGLGFGAVRLTQQEIEVFESLDITAEWDSSAICAALMLARAWEFDPRLRLPEQPPILSTPPHGLPPPDFSGFARSLTDGDGRVDRPVERALERLLSLRSDLSSVQLDYLEGLLRRARDPERSLTFHLIQEFNLGSELFREVYRRPGGLNTPGMLATQDRPTLPTEVVRRLDTWRRGADRHVAVITNRPSRSQGTMFNTPEAEIGVRVAGVEGWPFVASGALGWFAERHGLPPQAYLKPSPVHVLAGMRLAVDGDVESALAAAHDLVTDRAAVVLWNDLEGARVGVFEDAAKGMRGARAARDVLASAGVPIELELYGIARSPEKSRALEAVGARVFDSIRPALREALTDDL